MKPRFQADNDLRNSIRTAVLRREPSIDFQSAPAAGLHKRDFLNAGNSSPGVLVVPQEASTGEVIESIFLIWIVSEADEWMDQPENGS